MEDRRNAVRWTRGRLFIGQEENYLEASDLEVKRNVIWKTGGHEGDKEDMRKVIWKTGEMRIGEQEEGYL